MMRPQNLRLNGCLRCYWALTNLGGTWGHLGARHLYLLMHGSGGELIHRYAREWGHFDTTICVPRGHSAPSCHHTQRFLEIPNRLSFPRKRNRGCRRTAEAERCNKQDREHRSQELMASPPKLVRMESQDRPVSIASPRLLTAEDVAQITGLSVETLAQWRSQRRGIPFVKISRNCVRYRQCDLDAWLTERIVRVEDPSSSRRNP